MKHIITIIKKELHRVLTDRSAIFSLIVPGIILFVLYTFIGNVTFEPDVPTTFTVSGINIPVELDNSLGAIVIFNEITEADLEYAKEAVINGEISAVFVFDDNFWNNIGSNQTPNVDIFYNSGSLASSTAVQIVLATINALHPQFNVGEHNVGGENEIATMLMALLLPMLLLTFTFSAAISIVPESVAGEKERGTMATLLATPTKRGEIALGKIFSLSILSLISATSSFLGLIFSLPNMAGVSNIGELLSVADLILLYLIIVSVVLVVTGLMVILSTYAKNVKEAGIITMPLMFLSMFIGILNLVLGIPTHIGFAFIPLYNMVASIGLILQGTSGMIPFLVLTFVVNVFYMAICAVITAKMFNSERVMFTK